MRAVAGTEWSSGNEPKSMKHSLYKGIPSKSSRLLLRQLKIALSESTIRPSDHWSNLLSQTVGCFPQSDLPTTLSARGDPLQRFTICNKNWQGRFTKCYNQTEQVNCGLAIIDKVSIFLLSFFPRKMENKSGNKLARLHYDEIFFDESMGTSFSFLSN